MRDDYLWVEKYRPKTIDDCILPQQIKETFQTFVDQQNVPNLLLTGGPGVGKTSVAKAMLEQLDSDYIVVNGSMSGNCLLYTSPSPRDKRQSRMPSSA